MSDETTNTLPSADNPPRCAEAPGSDLLKKPFEAATYLAESLRYANNECDDIARMLDGATDDDVWQVIERAKEKLRDMDDHFCGTSIGCATDFGAWMTQDGWKPGHTHPLTGGFYDQNTVHEPTRRTVPRIQK